MGEDPIVVFAGSGSRRLTGRICDYLGIAPAPQRGAAVLARATSSCGCSRTCAGLRTYVVQSTVFPANDNFMELLFWIDAFKRASAESVTAIIPYFSYAKGDKKDEPRVSIRARVCADAIEVAGADRVVTMDLHAPQIQGFFHVPVDDLYALPVLCERVRAEGAQDLVVVSPDAGFAKQARKFAAALGCSVVIADKVRTGHDEAAEVLEIIGDVEGKAALVVDDFTISGGTLADVARALKARGARARLRGRQPRRPVGRRAREARGEPDHEALHHGQRGEPAGRGCRRTWRWSPWRRCSARPSSASTTARASARCSPARAAAYISLLRAATSSLED